jgi:trk system potassium uptake protein TrkA
MKIIIVGAGEVGFHSAQRLSNENQDVVLIDNDPDKIKRITDNLDVQALLGSGTSPGILKSGGIIDADMVVAATDSDEVNLITCLLAGHMNHYILKVARVRNPEYLDENELFGKELLGIDQIINPESVMVDKIRNLIMVPRASDVIDFVDGKVILIGITIKSDSPFVDRQLLSFSDPEKRFLIGTIVRGEKVFIPRGDDKFQANDMIYIVVKSDECEGVLDFFGIKREVLHRVIIVGGGQTGTALANSLDSTRLSVRIIEKDTDRCAKLSEMLDRVTVIKGDGTDRTLLLEENIGDVDYLVAVTGDEESNVLISLLAKELGAKKTITRINKLSYIPLVSAIGIDTVVSTRLSTVRAILQYIRRGKIISVAPLKGEHAEAIEAEALATSEIVDKPLAKVRFPKGTLVGAIIRNDEIIIPSGDSIVRDKDHLIIFTLREAITQLEKLLTVKLDYF